MFKRYSFVAVVVISLTLAAAFTSWTSEAVAPTGTTSASSVRAWPPDTSSHSRPRVAADSTGAAKGFVFPGIYLTDVNPNDTLDGSEPSVAIDPNNPNNIVVHGGFGGWNGDAPYYTSSDGGVTWTRVNSIPPPPGAASTGGCPCDTTIDWGIDSILYGAFLTSATDIFSGSNSTPATSLFSYFLSGGNAQLTDFNAGSFNGADQPWLIVNRDPTTSTQVNTYVGYDNFNVGPPDQRVSAAIGTTPPNFTADNLAITGSGGGGINPGLRMAGDPRTGIIYTLAQACTANCGGSPKTISYILNRSTDAGTNWSLNGFPNGISVASGVTIQPTPKFGTANALLGGIDHLAVNPTTGDVFVVFGGSNGSGGNGVGIVKVTFDASGNATAGKNHRVSPAGVEAALPSVAVAPDGTVGVLYTSFDGFSSDGFPIYSGHFAFSTDQGVTFTDKTLLTFLSPATDNGDARQRVLGDYQELKTVGGTQAGGTFYGVFTGNGAALGKSTASSDPIFFKVTLAPQLTTNPSLPIGDVCRGSTGQAQMELSNTGADDLIVSSITRTSGSTDLSIVSTPSFPLTISPDAHYDFTVACAPTTLGAKTATFTIASNDPANPNTLVTATCNAASGTISVTGSTSFGGQVCGGSTPAQSVTVNNIGTCDLNVASAVVSCADFTLESNPFPARISPDSGLGLTVQFTPTSAGPKSCNLTITSDDPSNPALVVPLTGTTPTGSTSLSVPAGLTFPPTVIQADAACNSQLGVPVANTGSCPVKVTNVAISGANATDYALTGLTGLPATVAPGDQLGSGGLNAVFAPLAVNRTSTASVDVTFEDDPITHTTATDSIPVCGEAVNRGVRVLVLQGGVPVPVVKRITLQRALAPDQGQPIQTHQTLKNVPLNTVTASGPCPGFQYHAEFGGATNPTQLKAGTYRLKVKIKGQKRKLVKFNINTCSFTPLLVVNF
jgi:HYDIN/CFA65/VesB-like, Ig-like domain